MVVGEKIYSVHIYSVQIIGKYIQEVHPPLAWYNHKFLHVRQPLPINFPQKSSLPTKVYFLEKKSPLPLLQKEKLFFISFPYLYIYKLCMSHKNIEISKFKTRYVFLFFMELYIHTSKGNA